MVRTFGALGQGLSEVLLEHKDDRSLSGSYGTKTWTVPIEGDLVTERERSSLLWLFKFGGIVRAPFTSGLYRFGCSNLAVPLHSSLIFYLFV